MREPPRQIGRYRVLGQIGSGGMGVVYAAEDTRLSREVAIKCLHPAAGDEVARARLWREARALAQVNHPKVCQVFEVGEEAQSLYLVMERLEGESLAHRLVRGAVPLAETIDLALEILDALAAMHARGLVHRDLKPSNVFLTPSGVKLLDLGLALPLPETLLGADDRITRTGTLVGTPGFMAPEQWRGEAVGPASDLFALGALLFEMASGRPAFEGRGPLDLYHAVVHEEPPALTGGPAVDALDLVVRRALAKEPAQRPPSAAAMTEALRAVRTRVVGGEQVQARGLRRMLVLPFRAAGLDRESAFLPMGLADALVASLSGLEGLVVKASQIGARYAEDPLDFRRIAREAEVHLVLTGTLLRAGERVRVAAQLVEVPDGRVAWSETMQLVSGDLFALQDDLARRIACRLSVPLAVRPEAALQCDVPASPEAYEYYLRANQLSWNFGMLAAARDLYRACLQEDPGYAPAWARLGRVYRVLAKYGHMDVDEGVRLARESFERALSLNPALSIAHNYYAYFEIEEMGRPKDAMVRLLAQARARPTDADLLAGLVVACRFCGLLQASVEADRRARRLDPGIRTSVHYTWWMLGEWETAIRRDDEDLRWIHHYALPLLGRDAEAIAGLREREQRASGAFERQLLRGTRAAIEGDREACLAAHRALGSPFRDPEGQFFTARNLARVGERRGAIEVLEGCVARGFSCDATLAADPWLLPLHGEPRFQAVLERARLGREAAEAAFDAAGGAVLLPVAAATA